MNMNERSPDQPASDSKPILSQPLHTTKELAEHFRVTEPTILEWINDGILIAAKFGKSYFVSQDALEQSFRAREEEHRRKVARKRRDEELPRELARLQEQDPRLLWEQLPCLVCGHESVLTSRYMRLDGAAFCAACSPSTTDGLSKEAWDRQVSLQVKEWNVAAEDGWLADPMQDQLWEHWTRPDGVEEQEQYQEYQGYEPPWVLYLCPICRKPHPLERRLVLDQAFYVWCDHAAPFGNGVAAQSLLEIEGKFDPRVVQYLAKFEAVERTGRIKAIYKFFVTLCAHCGLVQAVPGLGIDLIGQSACRVCLRDGSSVDPRHRAQVICDVQSGLTPRTCGCGKWEVVDASAGESLVLSWCEKRPAPELAALARDYIERRSLAPELAETLLSSLPNPQDTTL